MPLHCPSEKPQPVEVNKDFQSVFVTGSVIPSVVIVLKIVFCAIQSVTIGDLAKIS